MTTNVKQFIKWLFSDRKHPRPAIYYPKNGWITDQKEVERVMREKGLEL